MTTTTTVPTTSTTLPASGPVSFRSTHNRYALTIDVARLLGPYDPGNEAWDGEARIVRGPRFTDLVPVTGGDVFLVGLPWTGDAASLAQMFVDHAAELHGCSRAMGQRPVTLGGSPAVLFTVDSCGNENAVFVRAAVVHDGFGLIAFVQAIPGSESQYADHLLSVLTGLSWS